MSAPIRSLLIALTALLLALLPAGAASANVENFTYAQWSSEYRISLDEEGRAHAHVTETLVARFPMHDQNRGIVRGLPTRYLGADLGTRVVSITDEHGDEVPYSAEREDGTLLLALGTDDFVHGLTTYVIEYEMRDVMIAATDSGNDEFYWNLLPLRSNQLIEAFDTTITFSPELSARLTGDQACYEGYSGSTQRCEIADPAFTGGAAQFRVSSGQRAPGYGLTVAIGFAPGTVTQPLSRQAGALTDVAPFLALGGGAVTATVGGFALASMRRRARTATGIIVAQYEVPDDLPPLVASPIFPGARHIIPAQITHLAVRGVLRIHAPEKSAPPSLTLADPARVGDPIDAEARDRLFEGSTVTTLPKGSETFAKKMGRLLKSGDRAATARGLLRKQRSPLARLMLWVTVALVGSAVLLSIVGTVMGRDSAEPALFTSLIVGALVLVFAFGFGARHLVHTPLGAQAYEHLAGVREFIRVAEADRLRMLQSVSGAERYREGSVELVHLYERLLPYAMLFGLEKSWGKVLEVTYGSAHSAPSWIIGAGGLSTSLSSFSSATQASSTYSSSSSSGGSTGGGFSGGGGGGGSSGGR